MKKEKIQGIKLIRYDDKEETILVSFKSNQKLYNVKTKDWNKPLTKEEEHALLQFLQINSIDLLEKRVVLEYWKKMFDLNLRLYRETSELFSTDNDERWYYRELVRIIDKIKVYSDSLSYQNRLNSANKYNTINKMTAILINTLQSKNITSKDKEACIKALNTLRKIGYEDIDNLDAYLKNIIMNKAIA